MAFLSIAAGALTLAMRTRIVRYVASWQEHAMHLQYGPKEVLAAKAATTIAGIGFIIAGVLMLAGVG